jgi:hypothetical protein
MENNTMKKIDTKSLQIFEDMKSGFKKWIRDQDDKYTINEDPLRYEVTMEFSSSGEILWARYIPECKNLYVGMTYPHQIPKEKIPFTLAYLNLQSYCAPLLNQALQHLTLCPVCHRVDAVIGIPLMRERLPKGKFQMLLTISKLMSGFGQYQAIGAIAYKKNSVESLASPFSVEFPEFAKRFGGGL